MCDHGREQVEPVSRAEREARAEANRQGQERLQRDRIGRRPGLAANLTEDCRQGAEEDRHLPGDLDAAIHQVNDEDRADGDGDRPQLRRLHVVERAEKPVEEPAGDGEVHPALDRVAQEVQPRGHDPVGGPTVRLT